MRGHIKIGRWLPFRARQVLNPHHGFVWAVRTAGVISGSDRYTDAAGGQDRKLAGPLIVMHADGPNVSRSAAGRASRQCGGAYFTTLTQRTVRAGIPAGTNAGQQPRRVHRSTTVTCRTSGRPL